MYATIDGIIEYLGTDPNKIGEREDLEELLADCEARIRAYIIPNTPRCDEQIEAFCAAVYAQVSYECSAVNAQMADMPSGMTGFTVNGFSASFSDSAGDGLSSVGLCKRARAELLYAGLLYRGVCVC